jgi:hypothetical protein
MTVKGLEPHLQRRCQDGPICALYSRPPVTRYGADHDEYTTFFTGSTGKVVEVRQVLTEGGVRLVEYTAKSP